jgi:taurine--2-oxoglutarate transaminase
MMVDRVANECMNNGAYVSSWINYLIIAPPLIIKKEEIDEGVNALDRSLTIADKEVA